MLQDIIDHAPLTQRAQQCSADIPLQSGMNKQVLQSAGIWK